MKKALIRTFIFQLLLGIASFFVYVLVYFLLEQYVDIILLPLAVLITVLTFAIYRFVFCKYVNVDFNNKQKALYFLCFVIVSQLCALFGLIKSEFLNIISTIFQQTYYLAGLITEQEPNFIGVSIIFLIENIIKASLLLFKRNKNNQ